MDVSKKTLKIIITAISISLLFILAFIVVDNYIFPDSCGLMLLVPILLLSYVVVLAGGIWLLIIGLMRYTNKSNPP